jgi:hypothetical protein
MKFVCSMMAALVMALPTAVAAQSKHGTKEEQEDAKRHRTMAAAHAAAAKCLEAGSGEKACLEQLRKDCKGVGIGKYCGMKHQH